MNDSIKISELFDLNETIAADIFESYGTIRFINMLS